VLPEDIAAGCEERAVSTYISPPFVTQAAVHELLDRGAFEPNLERIVGLLRSRRDAMLAALERELDGGASWSRPEGGYFVWLDLPDGTDAAELLERATAAGVTFVRGADFFPGGSDGRSSARLAFSYESPERIAEGVSLLADLLRR
jgi:2-aminoadipate transaminase